MPYVVHCHPDNLRFFRRAAGRASLPAGPLAWALAGIEVRTSEFLPRTHKVWVPPKGKFWECTESDAAWAIPLGIGKFMDAPFFMGSEVPARPGRHPGRLSEPRAADGPARSQR